MIPQSSDRHIIVDDIHMFGKSSNILGGMTMVTCTETKQCHNCIFILYRRSLLICRPGSVIADFTVTYRMPARNPGLSLKLLFEDDQIVIERNIQQTLEQSFYKALREHIDQRFYSPDEESNTSPLIAELGITRDDIELRSPGESI